MLGRGRRRAAAQPCSRAAVQSHVLHGTSLGTVAVAAVVWREGGGRRWGWRWRGSSRIRGEKWETCLIKFEMEVVTCGGITLLA